MASEERDPVFVLIHSALVGPTSWSPVAHELERRCRLAVVPSLLGVAGAAAPQWHVPEAVGAATARIRKPIVVVGHSGGGPLLPAIADALTVELAALVFVDSLLPPARPAGCRWHRRRSWISCTRWRPMACSRPGRAGLARTPCANWSPTTGCAPPPGGGNASPAAVLLRANRAFDGTFSPRVDRPDTLAAAPCC